MEQLIGLDEQVFLFINNAGSPFWDPFWIFMSDKYLQIPIYLIFAYFLYQSQGTKNTILAIIAVALLILLADQTANLFKRHLFERPRPCRMTHLVPYIRYVIDRCIGNSYFSGHAANTGAIAVFLSFMYRKKYPFMGIVVVLWALLTGYSRIYLAQHFLGDVFTGFLVGSLYALLVYMLWIRASAMIKDK